MSIDRSAGRSDSPLRSNSMRLVASFGLVQVLVAVGAIIRIPLTTSAIGLAGFGVVMVIGAAVPLLLVPGAALRQTSRSVIPELLGADRGDLVRSCHARGVAIARRVALVEVVVIGGVAVMNPFGFAAAGPTIAASVVAVVAAALALDGLWWWGALEAYGRAATPNLTVAAVTIVGTMLAVVLWWFDASVAVFAVLTVATSTVPMFVVSMLGRRVARQRGDAVQRGVAYRARAEVETVGLFATTRLFGVRAFAEVVTRGTDPFVVQLVVSSVAVGTLSVVTRLGAGVGLVAIALIPRLAAGTAYRRGQGLVSAAKVFEQSRRQTAVAGVLAVGFLLLGPWVAALLAGEELQHERSLFVATALLGLLVAAEAPLSAALTAPGALRSTSRIAVLAAGLNISASVLLASRLGVEGPVLGSCLAFVLLLGGQALLIQRHPDLLHERRVSPTGIGEGISSTDVRHGGTPS